jgi:hypothetical protein
VNKEAVLVDAKPADNVSVYDGLAELFLVSSGLAAIFVAILAARKNVCKQERLRLLEQAHGRKSFDVKQPGRA